MNSLRLINLLLCAVFSIICLCGCSSPPPAQEVTYPALSEIPSVPVYSETLQTWNLDAVCWVGTAPDAKWNQVSGNYAQTQFHTTVAPLIRDALTQQGYSVKCFENQYMTREKRLSLQRIILCDGFEIKRIRVQEGVCYDMKLSVTVLHNPEQTNQARFDVWGRSVVGVDEKVEWSKLYSICVFNLFNMPEFRQALELDRHA